MMAAGRRRRLVVSAILLGMFLLAWGIWSWHRSPRAGEVTAVRTEVIVIRQEMPVASPAGGRLELLVSEGDRVAADQPIARIWPLLGGKNDSLPVMSPQPGLISFSLDGLETVLTPEYWSGLRPERLMTLAPGREPQVRDGETISQGKLICKIVDNLNPVLLVGYWPQDVSWQPASGDRVTVRSGAGEWLPAEVKRFDGHLTAIRLDRWTADWLGIRRLSVDVRGRNSE